MSDLIYNVADIVRLSSRTILLVTGSPCPRKYLTGLRLNHVFPELVASMCVKKSLEETKQRSGQSSGKQRISCRSGKLSGMHFSVQCMLRM